MDDIATRKQILHVLAASCVQSCQFFASMLQEQLFQLESEYAIKSENQLRHMSLISAISAISAWQFNFHSLFEKPFIK
jgi:hypothetical protein